MSTLKLVSLNLRAPDIAELDTLEVAASGLNILLDGHKSLGLDIDDYTLMENAKLTMGDHAAELSITDADFDRIYKNANNALIAILASQANEIIAFAASLNGISDVMLFEYPGIIRMCVKEGEENGINGNSLLYYTKSPDYPGNPY